MGFLEGKDLVPIEVDPKSFDSAAVDVDLRPPLREEVFTVALNSCVPDSSRKGRHRALVAWSEREDT